MTSLSDEWEEGRRSSRERIFKKLTSLQDYREKKEPPVEKTERGKSFATGRVDCRGRSEKKEKKGKEKKRKIGMKPGSGMFALPARKGKKKKCGDHVCSTNLHFRLQGAGKAKNESPSLPPPLPR